MKTKKKKSFLSIVVILGFISFVPVTLSAFGSVEENGDYTQSMNERFTASIDKIDIEIVSYLVTIESHDSDEILVEADIKNSGYENPLTAKISGGTLSIEHPKNLGRDMYTWNFFGKSRSKLGEGSIVVKVPTQFRGSLRVDTSSGDKVLTDVSATSIMLRASSGDTRAEGLSSAGDIIISASSGDINLQDIESIDGRLSVDTSSGDKVLTDVSATSIMVSASSGDTRAEGLSSAGDIVISASSGDINLQDIESIDGRLSVDTSSGDKVLTDVSATGIMLRASSGGTSAEGLYSAGDIVISASSGKINLQDIESIDGRVSVDTSSGTKVLTTVSAASIMLSASSGGTSAEGLSATSIYVKSTSGQINLNKITCTDITSEGTSGNLTFTALNAENIAIKTRSGYVRGSIVGKQSDFSVISTLSGGKNNLFNQASGGSKTLNVSSDNIDISFIE